MRLDMRFTGPVTPFTACVGRLFLAAGDTLEMRVLVKLERNIGMASLADDASYVSGFGRLSAACRTNEPDDYERFYNAL
jgi:hypothetical protein